MEYKASLDILARIITACTFALFAVLGYNNVAEIIAAQGDMTTIVFHSGALLLLIAIFFGCWLYAPQSYRMDSHDLIINRPAGSKKIKLADIAEIKVLADSEISGAMRTFGVGGLFGYYGKFYASKTGSMTFYTTQRKNKILIKTKQGKKIVITPDDISIIEKLKEQLVKISPGSN